ncbi:hypothetical protein KC19_12G048100 [Ceratodon purpureus]|uniref:Uncharacterized protein n=1 Tax=Ceratodon purpureus TaxID=3225 RepID=A0A8T0G4B7_CERPU|nr:hypothetical protein KC19_12G048100 [Ceratodon purpureus]
MERMHVTVKFQTIVHMLVHQLFMSSSVVHQFMLDRQVSNDCSYDSKHKHMAAALLSTETLEMNQYMVCHT